MLNDGIHRTVGPEAGKRDGALPLKLNPKLDENKVDTLQLFRLQLLLFIENFSTLSLLTLLFLLVVSYVVMIYAVSRSLSHVYSSTTYFMNLYIDIDS